MTSAFEQKPGLDVNSWSVTYCMWLMVVNYSWALLHIYLKEREISISLGSNEIIM